MPIDLEHVAVRMIQGLQVNEEFSRRADLAKVTRGREYDKQNLYIRGGGQAPWREIATNVYATGWQGGIGNETPEDIDAPQPYNIPLYQSQGKILQGALSNTMPLARWRAVNSDDPKDVITAKAKNDITELFWRNNPNDEVQPKMCSYFYTDGAFLCYVRSKEDPARFGYRNEPIMEQVPMPVPEGYQCPQCGAAGEPAEVEQMGCPNCGAPFNPEGLTPPSEVMQNVQTGSRKLPNAAEVISIYGKLNYRVPANAGDIPDCLYAQIVEEVSIWSLKAVFPDKADKIMGGDQPVAPTDTTERYTRLALNTTPGGMQGQQQYGVTYGGDTATYTRTWFRPAAYWILDEQTRDELFAAYPDGMYVEMCGTTLLTDPRNESMDDHLYIAHCYPGEGQIRESMGAPILDLQDAVSDGYNTAIDCMRRSVSTTFVDNEVLSRQDMKKTPVLAGSMYPVNNAKGDMARSFFETQPSKMDQSSLNLLNQMLFDLPAQFLGTQPVMQGAPSNQRTSSGLKLQLDQSLGRIGPAWRSLRRAYVKISELAVGVFVKSRNTDVDLPSIGTAGSSKSVVIRKEDLQGSAVAYCESDETFPLSPADRREMLMMLMQNPAFNVLAPENYDQVKPLLGFDFELPGEKAREKQVREIQRLLMGAPEPVMAVDEFGAEVQAIDPMTGQPMFQPSVPVNKLENHEAHLSTLRSWIETEEAEQMERDNPEGFQNVMLHAQAHEMMLAPPPMPMMPGGAPGLPPPPPGGPGAPPPEGLAAQGPPGASEGDAAMAMGG